MTINGIIVEGNTADGSSGGLFMSTGNYTVWLENSSIADNTAKGPVGGGGIFVNAEGNVEPALRIEECSVTGNSAPEGYVYY